jgi:hypothetical protein
MCAVSLVLALIVKTKIVPIFVFFFLPPAEAKPIISYYCIGTTLPDFNFFFNRTQRRRRRHANYLSALGIFYTYATLTVHLKKEWFYAVKS